jgi:hypothetical protein
MGWAAYQVEGDTYHPVTTDFAVDDWNDENYRNDLLAAQIGKPEYFSDDAHLTGLDMWGFNCYRGQSFSVSDQAGMIRNIFTDYPEISNKPMWFSEYGIDAWDHENEREDQDTQAAWISSLWQEIDQHLDQCVGGAVFSYSDEWWKNQTVDDNDPAAHKPGPYQRGDQPDKWSDEEYYGIMAVLSEDEIDKIIPRKAYYALGNAWGVNWPPRLSIPMKTIRLPESSLNTPLIPLPEPMAVGRFADR